MWSLVSMALVAVFGTLIFAKRKEGGGASNKEALAGALVAAVVVAVAWSISPWAFWPISVVFCLFLLVALFGYPNSECPVPDPVGDAGFFDEDMDPEALAIDVVGFEYIDRDGVYSDRVVAVHDLERDWFEGWCHVAGAKRSFRYDRVLEGNITRVDTGERMSVGKWRRELGA